MSVALIFNKQTSSSDNFYIDQLHMVGHNLSWIVVIFNYQASIIFVLRNKSVTIVNRKRNKTKNVFCWIVYSIILTLKQYVFLFWVKINIFGSKLKITKLI